MALSIMPFNLKTNCCRKINVTHKVNAQRMDVERSFNYIFKLKKLISIKNPGSHFKLENLNNQEFRTHAYARCLLINSDSIGEIRIRISDHEFRSGVVTFIQPFLRTLLD